MISGLAGEHARRAQDHGSLFALAIGQGKSGLDPLQPLLDISGQIPKSIIDGSHAQKPVLATGVFGGVVKAGPNVFVFGLDLGENAFVLRAEKLILGCSAKFGRPGQEPLEDRPNDLRRDAFGAILPDRFQHPIPGHLRAFHLNEQIVHQAFKIVQHIELVIVEIGCRNLGDLERASGWQQAKAEQEIFLRRLEQIEAPFHRGAQGPVPGVRVRGPAFQHVQPLGKPFVELLGGKDAKTGGGKLDGEGHAFQG